MTTLSKENILSYLQELSEEMGKEGLKGEILIFGGAAMVLVFNSRPSTKDVDAIFQPKSKIFEVSKKIAERHQLPDDWLNDSVKGFVKSDSFEYNLFVRHKNLSVYIPEPEYLLAMKCISMRIAVESSDIHDIQILIKHLGLKAINDVFSIIEKYYPRNQIPQKTYYAIEEILENLFKEQ